MAMGYEPEDLPWEVPAGRARPRFDDGRCGSRTRVEYDFDLPPIQLQAVRDANLYNVEKLIEYAIEHRDEVQDLHEHQKAQTADDDRRGPGRHAVRGDASVAGRARTRHQGPSPRRRSDRQRFRRPPTDPSGPAAAQPAAPNLAGAAQTLNQQAVAAAAQLRHPAAGCRRAGSPSQPGRSSPASHRAASSTTCPRLDDASATKMAERLSERAEGTITVDDVRAAETIEQLATTVREFLEAGQIDGFVRTLRPRLEGSTKPAVFVFHAAAARRWSTSRC